MRLSRTMIAGAAVTFLAAGSARAQTTPPPQTPPPQTKPTTPAPPPTTPATPAAPSPPAPYPEGAKVAYVDLQAVVANSNEGKAASARLQDLEKKKIAEIEAKNKALESARTKRSTGAAVLNESAQLALDREIDKLTREVQYLQQEAQAERNELQEELRIDFQRKLAPVFEALGKEKSLHVILDAANSGAFWANPGLDLTGEVIKRLDASKAPAPPKK
jgi:outer membrane protein